MNAVKSNILNKSLVVLLLSVAAATLMPAQQTQSDKAAKEKNQEAGQGEASGSTLTAVRR